MFYTINILHGIIPFGTIKGLPPPICWGSYRIGSFLGSWRLYLINTRKYHLRQFYSLPYPVVEGELTDWAVGAGSFKKVRILSPCTFVG